MKRNTNIILLVLSAFALAVLLAGCDGNPQDEVDEAVVVLDRAIEAIEQRSLRWQSVMEESGDELVELGQSGIADEMSEAIGRFFADLGTPAHCRPDFVHNRLRDDLVRLRAKLTEEELQLSPVFCAPNPNVVRITDVQDGSVDSVEISGYNLDFANIQVLLVDAENQQIDVSHFLTSPSQYLYVLNLGESGVPLMSSSSELLFALDANETKSVSIIQ